MGNFKIKRMKKNHHKKFILNHRPNSFKRRAGKTNRNMSTCQRHSENFSHLILKGIGEHKQNIIMGKKLGRFGKSSVYLGIDMKVGNIVAVLQLVGDWRNIDLSDTRKTDKIFQLENHLKLLLNLKHPFLSQYKGWQHNSSTEKILVNIMSEYCGEISLAVFTKKTSQQILPLEVVRAYTHEILQAIEYLHLKSLAHRNLTLSNIFLDQEGKLKIIGYGLTNRVEDLFDNDHFNNIYQREDLYCLGLLVLSLLLGKPHLRKELEIPKNLPQVIADFLHICLEKNKFPHLNSKELLAHHFVCELFPKTLTFKRISNKQKNYLVNGSNQSVENKCKIESLSLSDATLRQSRLNGEFEIIKVLGKGGFGDVYKVKNKIDGGVYAIKKIILNPKSKKFNAKMLREVKLLSKLKHEHVVRYYCSWIEVAHVSVNPNTSSCCTSLIDSYSHNSVRTKASLLSNFDLFRDVENLVPEEVSVEWLVSFDSLEVETIGKFYADNEDDTEYDNQENSIFKKEKFFNFSSLKTYDETSQRADLHFTTELKMTQILFIQMECCDERTLRNTIDKGLCNNKDRIWRLFREIIEGLAHIHEKGIIHRDLKPVNIFLDSFDHVKIGDFGLARTDILCKVQGIEAHDKVIQDLDSSLSDDSIGENSLTGAIGTVYYVGPELMAHSSRLYYSQKVDMYSLGIIFFEMCYRCLETEHERGKILNNLRLSTIVFPKDFDIHENAVQAKIIRWLLAHDPKLRPTCKELLNSYLLNFNQSIVSTSHCPSSNSDCKMFTGIFDQKTLNEQDGNYDFATYAKTITWPTALLYQQLKSVITHIFTTHGAIHIPLPLFMPISHVYNDDKQLVRLMNSKGGIISLPLDQRVSFARFIGRKNICSMKRFAIEKVYREKENQDVYPTELIECAFDIISSSNSLIPDSEVFIVVQEIVDKYPTLKARKLSVKMNHMLLLKALLLYCGIPEDAHTKVLLALAITRVSANRATLLEKNCGVKLSEAMMTQLNSYLDTESSLDKITLILKDLTLSPNKVGVLTKAGLEEIKNIIDNATYMGLELQIMVSLGFIYKPNVYSGVVYQVLCDKMMNGKTDVIAAGGQYDKLIETFTLPAPNDTVCIQSHGVGISVFLEQLAVVVAEDEQIQRLAPCDFLICSLSNSDMTKEKLSLVKRMWAAGFKSDILLEKAQDITEVMNKCLYKGVSHVVVLMEINPITLQIYSLDNEPIVPRTMLIEQFMEYIQQEQIIGSSVSSSEPPWHEIYSMDTSWTDI